MGRGRPIPLGGGGDPRALPGKFCLLVQSGAPVIPKERALKKLITLSPSSEKINVLIFPLILFSFTRIFIC